MGFKSKEHDAPTPTVGVAGTAVWTAPEIIEKSGEFRNADGDFLWPDRGRGRRAEVAAKLKRGYGQLAGGAHSISSSSMSSCARISPRRAR